MPRPLPHWFPLPTASLCNGQILVAQVHRLTSGSLPVHWVRALPMRRWKHPEYLEIDPVRGGFLRLHCFPVFRWQLWQEVFNAAGMECDLIGAFHSQHQLEHVHCFIWPIPGRGRLLVIHPHRHVHHLGSSAILNAAEIFGSPSILFRHFGNSDWNHVLPGPAVEDHHFLQLFPAKHRNSVPLYLLPRRNSQIFATSGTLISPGRIEQNGADQW